MMRISGAQVVKARGGLERATVIVAGLMVPGAVIEIVADAHLGKAS